MPAGGPLLVREGIECLLHEVAAAQHPGCARVLAGAGFAAAAGAGGGAGGGADEEARRKEEEKEKKRLATARQEAMLAEMRRQQAAAAAHMMLDGDDDDQLDDEAAQVGGSLEGGGGGLGHRSRAAQLVDPLGRLNGAECALCQEPMVPSGAAWSYMESATHTWVSYSDEAADSLEAAWAGLRDAPARTGGDGDPRARVGVLIHGDEYEVLLFGGDRMVMNGPREERGVRAGRLQRRFLVRREVNQTLLLGFAHPSPIAVRAAAAGGGGAGREASPRHPLVVTLCGHAMHRACLHKNMQSLVARRRDIIHGATFEQAWSRVALVLPAVTVPDVSLFGL